MAILLPSLRFGGAERVSVNLAHAMRQIGWNVTFLVMRGNGEMFEETRRSFAVIDLDCDRTRKLPLKLARYLANRPTDILLSSFWKVSLCACLARLGRRGTKLLLWEHSPPTLSRNSPTWLYALSASLFYRAATAIICVSEGIRSDVDRITVGLRSRLVTVHNPIPAPADDGPVVRAATGRRVAWVGRLENPKNPELLTDAVPFLADDVDIVYIGDGPLRRALERKGELMGLADRVHFTGYLPDPAAALRGCDLLVLTSDREGLPTVLVEAMHLGLRVVSTDCGQGVHEILDPDYGTIVPMNDPRALAAAIMAELGRAADPQAQRRGAARFAPDAIARKFLAAAGFSVPR